MDPSTAPRTRRRASGGPWAVALGLAALLAMSPTAGGQPCAGDCTGDGTVTIAELVAGVAIALGDRPVSSCTAMDGDGNARVSVDELVRAVAAALAGCPATRTPTAPHTATPTETPSPAATPFCALPGSVRYTAGGVELVPGGAPNAADLGFLHLPVGFCAHWFARVGNARQLRFAPGGELFVASPTQTTTGGGPDGLAAIVVLADDDGDGVAEAPTTFQSGLPATQGMLFTAGFFYYQDDTRIMRLPYTPGQRVAVGTPETVADITIYRSAIHWPKALDVADDGTIYVANGGDQGEPCIASHPFHGGILALDGSPGGRPVAKGFRNPVSLRCTRGNNRCYAIELTRDFTAEQGGREKLVPVRDGDDWGFPCCATRDLPFPDITPVPDCSGVAADNASFIVGHTPFDLDFETGRWPAPWTNRVFVPLHGAYVSWAGARVVSIARDPQTGEVLPGSELDPTSPGTLLEFASGWDDGTNAHGRPAVVAFAPDGRLFLGSDTTGDIIWIAPLDL